MSKESLLRDVQAEMAKIRALPHHEWSGLDGREDWERRRRMQRWHSRRLFDLEMLMRRVKAQAYDATPELDLEFVDVMDGVGFFQGQEYKSLEEDAEYTVAEMQCAIQCAEPGTDAVGALLAFRKRAFPQRMQFIDAWKALKGTAADGKVPTGPCGCPNEHPTLRSYESDCFICVCCQAVWTGRMLYMFGGGDKKTGRPYPRSTSMAVLHKGEAKKLEQWGIVRELSDLQRAELSDLQRAGVLRLDVPRPPEGSCSIAPNGFAQTWGTYGYAVVYKHIDATGQIQEMLDAAQNWPNANPAYGTVNRSPKAPSLSEVTAPNEPNRAAAEAQHKAHLAMIGEEFNRALDKDAVWTKTGDDTYDMQRGNW